MTNWTRDGRVLHRDGVPLLFLTRTGTDDDGRYSLAPWEADDLAQRIVELLNADEPEGTVERRPYQNANEDKLAAWANKGS